MVGGGQIKARDKRVACFEVSTWHGADTSAHFDSRNERFDIRAGHRDLARVYAIQNPIVDEPWDVLAAIDHKLVTTEVIL